MIIQIPFLFRDKTKEDFEAESKILESKRIYKHRLGIRNKINNFINELKNNYISRYWFLRSIENNNINLNAVSYKFLFTFINCDLWKEDIEKVNNIYCDVNLNFLELLKKE